MKKEGDKVTFQVELTDHKILKEAFESIAKITDEIVLECTSESIQLNALDKSHITFITMELDKTLFDTYQCDTPEKIFIDANDFMKMLKKANTSEILQLNIDETGLLITLKGDAVRKFKIQFIDFEYNSPQPPMIETPCNITIPSKLLKEYINDMSDFNDKLTFQVDENYLKILADGQIGNATIEYLHGEHISEFAQSHFSTPKLQEILSSSKFSESCKLGIGNDMPLILRMDLVTGDGYLSFLLAPRLEEE